MFREFRLEDSTNIVALLNDADVSRWTSHIPYPYSSDDAKSWLERQKYSNRKPLAIEVDNELVGCISHWELDASTTEVGYWIGKPFWGKGIATTALSKLLASPAFPSTPNVVAKVATKNIASQRVLEKCGFMLYNQCKVEKSECSIATLCYIKPTS